MDSQYKWCDVRTRYALFGHLDPIKLARAPDAYHRNIYRMPWTRHVMAPMFWTTGIWRLLPDV